MTDIQRSDGSFDGAQDKPVEELHQNVPNERHPAGVPVCGRN